MLLTAPAWCFASGTPLKPGATPPCIAENPYEANLFFVPALTYFYSDNMFNPQWHVERVMQHVRQQYPFYNRSGGLSMAHATMMGRAPWCSAGRQLPTNNFITGVTRVRSGCTVHLAGGSDHFWFTTADRGPCSLARDLQDSTIKVRNRPACQWHSCTCIAVGPGVAHAVCAYTMRHGYTTARVAFVWEPVPHERTHVQVVNFGMQQRNISWSVVKNKVGVCLLRLCLVWLFVLRSSRYTPWLY